MRNSFACIREKQVEKWAELGLTFNDLFKSTINLEVEYVKKQATEMDKQQTINDWRDGFLNGRISVRRDDFSTPQEYYNETYGGGEQ